MKLSSFRWGVAIFFWSILLGGVFGFLIDGSSVGVMIGGGVGGVFGGCTSGGLINTCRRQISYNLRTDIKSLGGNGGGMVGGTAGGGISVLIGMHIGGGGEIGLIIWAFIMFGCLGWIVSSGSVIGSVIREESKGVIDVDPLTLDAALTFAILVSWVGGFIVSGMFVAILDNLLGIGEWIGISEGEWIGIGKYLLVSFLVFVGALVGALVGRFVSVRILARWGLI